MKITRQKLVDGERIEFEDDMTPDEIRERIPQELTPRQIRLALIQSGISLSSIDNMIDNMKEPNQSVIRTLREYSLSYSRDDEMLIQFATTLGMNEEQLDNLFILGSTL